MPDRPPAGAATLDPPLAEDRFGDLEQYRTELRRYCRRILGSGFETEDAVQETFLRAWRNVDRFEGRAAIRTWLYRIATNVCLGMMTASQRRASPASVVLGGRNVPVGETAATTTGRTASFAEPVDNGDPAGVIVGRESVRLAFVAALQALSPRQRAVLILRDVLHWRAAEVAALLGTTVVAVNSALQRARAGLAARRESGAPTRAKIDDAERELLIRYVDAFERYDIEGLVALVRDDAAAGGAAPRGPKVDPSTDPGGTPHREASVWDPHTNRRGGQPRSGAIPGTTRAEHHGDW